LAQGSRLKTTIHEFMTLPHVIPLFLAISASYTEDARHADETVLLQVEKNLNHRNVTTDVNTRRSSQYARLDDRTRELKRIEAMTQAMKQSGLSEELMASSASSARSTSMLAAAIIAPNPETCTFGSVSAESCPRNLSRISTVRVPLPSPPIGWALIKVSASSINPTEWKNAFLLNKEGGVPLTYPYVTGIDFSGIVVSTAHLCNSFKPQDEVWGFGVQAHAEYVIHPCNFLGHKPKTLSFLQAGTLGVAGMTGLEGLAWTGALNRWTQWTAPVTVLVIGGSSGTGHFGVQLAKAFGAGKVISTCSEKNFDLVKSLGADLVIDYHMHDWWDPAVIPHKSIDIIYDCISLAGNANHAYDILAEGGKYVCLLPGCLADAAHVAQRPDLEQFTFIEKWVDTAHMDILTAQANAGNLTVSIGSVFNGLQQVPQLFNASMDGHAVGKLALVVDNETAMKI